MTTYYAAIVGKEIAGARRSAGLSRKELAEKSGVSLRQIGKIERGERGQFVEIIGLAKALDLAMSTLMAKAEPGGVVTANPPAMAAPTSEHVTRWRAEIDREPTGADVDAWAEVAGRRRAVALIILDALDKAEAALSFERQANADFGRAVATYVGDLRGPRAQGEST